MGEINAENWRRLRSLLDQSLDLPLEERAAFIANLPAEHCDLRADLERLLSEHGRTQPVLEQGIGGFVAPLLQRATVDRAEDSLGRRFGPYRVTRLLGVGGMGVVYLAERADGRFTQQVALKVVQTGVGESARSRFERERQILAGLVHPNIAALYDGGELEDGQSFYTMEYVDGVPITLYCREAGLNVEARVRLLREVAATLAHAHRNLIVHRDIKPSNILVTDSGQVKLLDFGIAKLIGSDEKTSAELTRTAGAGPMTPDYAAPEQFRNEPITIATDVYQLGMLCFRVFTGAMPYRADPGDPYAWARAVAEDEPISLSRSLDRAALRSTWSGTPDLARLRREFGGDLNAIVRKMLAKSPADRYASMDAARADLDAYLSRWPVSARRATFSYSVVRFARRHRIAVATAGIAFAAVVAIAVVALRQAHFANLAATQARREAEVRAVTASMVTDLLRAGPANGSAQRPMSAVQALDQNTERTLHSLIARPRRRAIAVGVLAASYLELDHAQRARTLIESTLPSVPDDDDMQPERLTLHLLLARAAAELGDADAAKQALKTAQTSIDSQQLAADVPERLAAGLTRVRIADHEGRRDEAIKLAAQLLHDSDRPGLRESLEFADALRINAVKDGDDNRAIVLLQRAYGIIATHYGEDSPQAMAIQRMVIIRDTVYGPRLLDSESLLAKQEASIRQAFGDQSTDYADVLQLRCEIAQTLKQTEKAEDYCRRVLAIRQNTEDSGSIALADAFDNEGALLLRLGKSDEALADFERELAIRKQRFAPNFQNVVHARLKIAEARCHSGAVAAAIGEFNAAIADYVEQVGPLHPYEAVYAAYFAGCLLDAGRRDDARAVLENHGKLDPPRANMSAQDHDDVAAVWQRLEQ